MKYRIISLLLIFVFALTSCASPKSEAFNQSAPSFADNMPAMEESSSSKDYDTGATASTDGNPPKRIVIRNADLSIVVKDPVTAMDFIGSMAERMGGYIVQSSTWKARNYQGTEVPEAKITIRVPVEQLDQALEEIKSLLTDKSLDLLREEVSGQDVTKEYTDLSSRLRNLEEAESQLKEIMDEAYKTEDVIEVFKQLTYYREQIEITKGQIKYYDESAALSAISVRIQAHEAVNPISIAGWKPSVTVSKALQSLVNAMQALVDGAIWLVLLIIPVIILILLPFYLLFLLIRSIVRRRKAKKQPAPVKEQD